MLVTGNDAMAKRHKRGRYRSQVKVFNNKMAKITMTRETGLSQFSWEALVLAQKGHCLREPLSVGHPQNEHLLEFIHRNEKGSIGSTI